MADALDGLKIDWQANHHRVVMISADKLRELRRGRGLTQTELAAKAGLSSKLVAKIERQDKQHRLATALKLARALGVAAKELQANATG